MDGRVAAHRADVVRARLAGFHPFPLPRTARVADEGPLTSAGAVVADADTAGEPGRQDPDPDAPYDAAHLRTALEPRRWPGRDTAAGCAARRGQVIEEHRER